MTDGGIDDWFNTKGDADWSERLLGIRSVLENIGTTLGKNDDWMQTVIVDCRPPMTGSLPPGMDEACRGKETRIIVGLAGLFDSEEGKEHAAMLMRLMAAKINAHAMTFISCVWMSMVATLSPSPAPPGETDKELHDRLLREAAEHQRKHGTPSQDPNRIEKLMMLSVVVGGEEDGSRQAFADIDRSGEHPVLKNWKLLSEGEGGFFGRFPDAIYKGMKAAADKRAKAGGTGV